MTDLKKKSKSNKIKEKLSSFGHPACDSAVHSWDGSKHPPGPQLASPLSWPPGSKDNFQPKINQFRF